MGSSTGQGLNLPGKVRLPEGASAVWRRGVGGGLFYCNLACQWFGFSALKDVLMGEKGVALAVCLGMSCSTAPKPPVGKVCRVRQVSFGERTVV